MMMMGMVGRKVKDLFLTTTRTIANANGGGGFAAETMLTRYFTTSSRARAPNLRKINPKVPPQEAASLAESLYHVIKQHEPLNISNTWNHAKESGINGLNSKTHMKLMLKWMRGRNMLKQFCNQVGSSKKFLLCTLPEDPQVAQSYNSMELKTKTKKSSKAKKPSKSKKLSTKRTKVRC